MPPRKTSGTEISTASTFLKEKKHRNQNDGWRVVEYEVSLWWYMFFDFLEVGEKDWSCQYTCTYIGGLTCPNWTLHMSYMMYKIYVWLSWNRLVVPAGGLENTPCPDTCYMFQRCTVSYKQKYMLYTCQKETHQYSMYIHSTLFCLCSLAI